MDEPRATARLEEGDLQDPREISILMGRINWELLLWKGLGPMKAPSKREKRRNDTKGSGFRRDPLPLFHSTLSVTLWLPSASSPP